MPLGFRPLRFLGDALDRERILAYSTILLALELGAFGFLVAGTHGLVVPLAEPTTTDFASFYAAGSLANAGTPQFAYDHARHLAAEEQATAAGIEYQFFYYPPTFLLLCALLARLPYLAAFVVFEVTSLVLYLVVACSILDRRGWASLVPLAAFPAVWWTLGLGQNAFLTAALFGAATLCVDRRPAVAGMLFGALCYKPHFALLVPVALAAGGHWRVFAAAFASAVGLSLLSLALFGWQTWQDFLSAAAASHATYESGRITFGGFASPFGAVLLLGGPTLAAYAVQAAATLAAGLLVATVWRRKLRLSIRAAVLAAATLVAVPVVLVYDLMLATVAAAWLVRAGGKSGLSAPEKAVLAILCILSVDPRSIAETWHIPIAPLIALALLALVVRRCSEQPDRARGRIARLPTADQVSTMRSAEIDGIRKYPEAVRTTN